MTKPMWHYREASGGSPNLLAALTSLARTHGQAALYAAYSPPMSRARDPRMRLRKLAGRDPARQLDYLAARRRDFARRDELRRSLYGLSRRGALLPFPSPRPTTPSLSCPSCGAATPPGHTSGTCGACGYDSFPRCQVCGSRSGSTPTNLGLKCVSCGNAWVADSEAGARGYTPRRNEARLRLMRHRIEAGW